MPDKRGKTPAVMIQGTGSNVGKSLIVAGLCRLFANRGLNVRPFKPQNMSNNAAVTSDGGEIGRAQALQAMGCRVPLTVHMNPVLLKPETDTGAQIIVQGKRFGTMRAREYGKHKAELLPRVIESFSKIESEADLVFVEGAGSPAEINLRAGDIANMGFAEAAGLPVILCADIDRGGVIASVVGTHSVLEPCEQKRVRAFFINRFRGDPSLFDDGMREIVQRTGWQGLGVVPWFADASKLPAEDALDLSSGGQGGSVKVVVPVMSRIANFDDLDPLRMEPGVTLELVNPGTPLPGDADLVLLPGSKSTIGDLTFFREQGWEVDLQAHVRRGGHVLGICGGYQMLGKTISDPDGIEGTAGTVKGLGFLDVDTVLTPDKSLVESTGTQVASGARVAGYEIHIGRTSGPDCGRPYLSIQASGGALKHDGAQSGDGRIAGTYLHGLFTDDDFRKAYLTGFGAVSDLAYAQRIDAVLDDLAVHLEDTLDIDAILEIAAAR
ncbi:cobyric acid synthase [Roseibium denhamense]|uniref:Cobyric acid synthase n=2 Tax=Roseibium denhamense TaxID=76305 RepID=A0ABY1PEE9_9HYPH|nr:cobyric acid synthase [Roseibium denhamense]MTI07829.1 cobyric acid synthase [Roseibium denhamense]SMP31808.1 adenosylcobyric acid synthase (glutamine-hydrolysing) [Roseibium denhamense]